MRELGFRTLGLKLAKPIFTTFRVIRRDKDWDIGEVFKVVFKPYSSDNRSILGQAEIVGKVPQNYPHKNKLTIAWRQYWIHSHEQKGHIATEWASLLRANGNYLNYQNPMWYFRDDVLNGIRDAATLRAALIIPKMR